MVLLVPMAFFRVFRLLESLPPSSLYVLKSLTNVMRQLPQLFLCRGSLCSTITHSYRKTQCKSEHLFVPELFLHSSLHFEGRQVTRLRSPVSCSTGLCRKHLKSRCLFHTGPCLAVAVVVLKATR